MLHLEALPFQPKEGVKPFYSVKAMDLHYKGYLANEVNKGNILIAHTEYMDIPPEHILQKAFLDASQRAIFNHAAEVWNHKFFFRCIQPIHNTPYTIAKQIVKGRMFDDSMLEMESVPKSQVKNEMEKLHLKSFFPTAVEEYIDRGPEGAIFLPFGQDLKAEIITHFGGFDQFKLKFERYAKALFGNGWVWLVDNQDGHLQIIATKDADNPLTKQLYPILALDMWEHSFLPDYQYDIDQYLTNFWKVVNWTEVERNYFNARARRFVDPNA